MVICFVVHLEHLEGSCSGVHHSWCRANNAHNNLNASEHILARRHSSTWPLFKPLRGMSTNT